MLSDCPNFAGADRKYLSNLNGGMSESIPMAHRYGIGHRLDMPTPEIRAEAQVVEHYLTVNVTNNGRTVSTSRLPMSAGAPITPAGGGSIVAPGPMQSVQPGGSRTTGPIG
jgi:hypothetical protein